MRKMAVQVLALTAVGALATGCATKGYVNESIADVNQRVETLASSLEETQEQTRVNSEGVATARREAATANQAAEEAGQSASDAGEAARAAGDRADAVGRDAERLMRLVYEVVLSQDEGNFAFGNAELPDGAKGAIDQLASQLKSEEQQNVYIEIEGHTDATGPPELNERLGLERAEAVKRYLHDSHEIPLHRINTISYGEDRPVAPNDTREGRAQNRRVVVRVLT